MSNTLTWSSYSKDIFTALRSQDPSDRHLIISAVAGSGKTTNAIELERILTTEYPELTVGFYAFNKDIVETLKSRLANAASARTLHSLGQNMLWAHLGFYPQVDKFKYRNLTEKALENLYFNDAESLNSAIRDIRDIVGKAMAELVYPKSETFFDDLDAVCDHFGLDIPSSMQKQDVYGIVRDILLKGEAIARVNPKKFGKVQSGICFDDMIYLPNLWDLRCPEVSSNPKVVTATSVCIGDEIQDMSKGKIHLALRSLKPGGRFIGFGDECQAIYGFAGADASSIPNIVAMLGAKVLPLSISYRCPQAIVREAQKIVAHIESAPNAPEGEVRTILDTQLLADGMLPPGALILSRKTNPLIKLCITLLKNRIPAKVKGRNIGAQLLTVAKEVVGKNGNFQDFDTKCNNYMEKRAEIMADWKDRDSRYEALSDRIEAVKAIVESYAPVNLAALSAAIDQLFSDGGSVITLSTVHRAKGLEYDDVFIINPEALPLNWKNQKDWEKQQEMNLKYVAITRAKQRLTYVRTTEKDAA
jgi:hypothetical protein